uniref:Eukaryotic translation initiation factor 2 subunit 2 n=2 Tax=Lepeophtheirus salmonis TaxID=72036 RepID=D3PHJ3_LEPSM|nr:Eukaryotic translation initiation factor 2 subunit 2 [Lepeophtheirus salmonis]
MTEEETVFDPTAKKKKKKKKTPFDLDGAVEGTTKESSSEKPAESEEKEDGTYPAEDDLDLDNLFKKKKKKKKTAIDGEEDTNETDEKGALSDGVDDLDLENFGKKKKKKKVKEPLTMEELDQAVDDIINEEESFGLKKKKKKVNTEFSDDEIEENKENITDSPWMTSDRDYTYDELLQRVFNIMKDKNPEVVAGEKKKFIMRPPQVVRVGTKKTAFVNFTEIARMLHRQAKHLLDFLSAELGTVGAIDGNNQLIMKGRFQQKHIESVLRRYIKEYVTCHTCRSPDTILNKEARLFFLQCMVCHSRCSVQTIKTGFQAVTGKRSAIRAKQ